MAKKYQAPVGASLVVIASVFYASYGIWTKLLGNFVDGFTATVLRGLLLVAILLPIAFVTKRLQPLRLRTNWQYYLITFVASIFSWGPLYFAILHAGLAISLTVTYASIVIGQFVLGWLFAGEKFTRDKILSAFLGCIGLALLFSPSLQAAGWLALLGAAVSGLASAINTLCTKKIHYNALQSTVVLWAVGLTSNAVMAAIFHSRYPAFELSTQWFYLLCFALASIIASWAMVRGVKLIDVGAAGVLGLMEVVFAVLFGVVFFHERPGIIALIGAAIIITAAAIPYLKDYNAQRGTLD